AVAPKAQIMPVKIFNPWGITSSGAIYAGFHYAVDHGARIILCGWATPVDSAALRQGVAYAKDHSVVVIAASGDEGADLSSSPYFPAAWSQSYDNVITVAGVDAEDQLMDTGFAPVVPPPSSSSSSSISLPPILPPI